MRVLIGHIKAFIAQMKVSIGFFAAASVITIVLASYIVSSNPGEILPIVLALPLWVMGYYAIKFSINLLQDEELSQWTWRGVYAAIVLLALSIPFAGYSEYRYYHQVSVDKARTKIDL